MRTDASTPMRDEILELVIDSLAAGGEGVGRGADGRVVFVPYSAPGDRLQVRIVEMHERFAHAEIETILEPGPVRVEAPCAVFGECGGCAWQHVAYPAQLAARRRILADALARIGGIEIDAIEMVASPQAYAYRGRARLLAQGGGVGFRRRHSHEPCPITQCPLLVPPLGAALAALAARADLEDGEWELALGSDGSVRTSALAAPQDSRPVHLTVLGERVEISPGVFAQANALLIEALARHVVEAAGSGGEALELFAGAGFFTLALARNFERLTAVESDPRAVADLARNLRAASLHHVRVVEAKSETVLADAAAQRVEPEVIVLDPPRGGVGSRAGRDLARIRARRVVHVSCDPATLARDLRELVQRGFRVTRVTGFDLFPQTPHVETVVVLDR